MNKYETTDYNNFSSVVKHPGTIEDGVMPRLIGRIIPHNYGFDAFAMPGGNDLACWATKQEAVQAIINHDRANV